jgi:hypothetical protein
MVSSDARARPSAAHIVECECAERCAERLLAPQRESPLTHRPVAQRDDAPGFHAQCSTRARACGAATQRNAKRSGRGFLYLARPRLALYIARLYIVGSIYIQRDRGWLYLYTARPHSWVGLGRSIGARQCGAVPHCALHTHTERSRCNTQHATCELRHYSRLQRATGNGQTGHVATGATRNAPLRVATRTLSWVLRVM